VAGDFIGGEAFLLDSPMVALSPCVHGETWVATAAEGEDEGPGAVEGREILTENETVTLGLLTVDGLTELAAHFPKFAQSFFSCVTRHLVLRMAKAQVCECVQAKPYSRRQACGAGRIAAGGESWS
jgi:hypothetical protein